MLVSIERVFLKRFPNFPSRTYFPIRSNAHAGIFLPPFEESGKDFSWERERVNTDNRRDLARLGHFVEYRFEDLDVKIIVKNGIKNIGEKKSGNSRSTIYVSRVSIAPKPETRGLDFRSLLSHPFLTIVARISVVQRIGTTGALCRQVTPLRRDFLINYARPRCPKIQFWTRGACNGIVQRTVTVRAEADISATRRYIHRLETIRRLRSLIDYSRSDSRYSLRGLPSDLSAAKVLTLRYRWGIEIRSTADIGFVISRLKKDRC